MSKAYEGNVQSKSYLVQLFLDTLAVSLRKKSEIVDEVLFSSPENVISSILLKYQEIYVQIQTFTDKN